MWMHLHGTGYTYQDDQDGIHDPADNRRDQDGIHDPADNRRDQDGIHDPADNRRGMLSVWHATSSPLVGSRHAVGAGVLEAFSGTTCRRESRTRPSWPPKCHTTAAAPPELKLEYVSVHGGVDVSFAVRYVLLCQPVHVAACAIALHCTHAAYRCMSEHTYEHIQSSARAQWCLQDCQLLSTAREGNYYATATFGTQALCVCMCIGEQIGFGI
jgi:hypothetical protein